MCKKRIIPIQRIHRYNIANQLMMSKVMIYPKIKLESSHAMVFFYGKFVARSLNVHRQTMECCRTGYLLIKLPSKVQPKHNTTTCLARTSVQVMPRKRGINNQPKSAWLCPEVLVHKCLADSSQDHLTMKRLFFHP